MQREKKQKIQKPAENNLFNLIVELKTQITSDSIFLTIKLG